MSRTIPSNPANSLTPSYTTVSSPAGFQTGDLVYYKDSSFGTIPGNAVSSANFPISGNTNQNQDAFNTTVNFANYNPLGQTGSTNNRAPSTALLTNGNLVVVYGEHGSSNGNGFFKIINQDGTVIVDRTDLGIGIIQNMGLIGVAALVGGGFAVAAKASGGNMQYGIFSNTGTVVTAMAADSSFGSSFVSFDIKPLSGGGFAIGMQPASGTGTFGFRSYSSVGVGNTYVTASGWSGTTACVLTTFSDNTFAALYPANSSDLKVTRFSNVGAVVANYSMGTSDYYNSSGFEFITLSTGTAVILYTESPSGNYFIYGKTYDQSTGSISGATTVSGAYSQYMNAKALSSGGFVMTAPEYTSGIRRLIRRNASFGQTGTIDLLSMPAYTSNNSGGQYQNTTIIEGTTYLTIVDNSYTTSSYSYHVLPFIQIDKANFTASGIRKRFPATTVVSETSASVSGYARSNSTPNSAAFLAATTQTLSLSMPASSGSTFVLTPYSAITESIRTQSMTVMNNGQFVIAYGTNSNAVKFSVFSSLGSLVSTTTVASSGASALVRCTCLGNGKLVISWVPTANNSVNFAVYSSAYVLLASTSLSSIAGNSISSPGSQDSSAGHDIAPFGNDFFVLATTNGGSSIFVSVINDSGVYQSNASNSYSSGINNIRMASDASGDVAVQFYASSAGSGSMMWFARDTSSNTLFAFNSQGLSDFTSQNYGENVALSPYGSAYGFISSSGTRRLTRNTPASAYNTSSIGSVSYNSSCVCVGQNGEFVTLQIDGTSQIYRRYGVNASTGNYGSTVGQSAYDSNSITISNYNTSASIGSQPQLANIYDNVYAFSYISATTNNIFVGILNTVAATYSTAITAGVTASNTALIPSPSNGYYLSGISASDCSAGGTGVLQVNGVASLSSQYPSGTTSQAFDFTSPALVTGVRGTIAGRNVILTGEQ
jgi:hypothetical protein